MKVNDFSQTLRKLRKYIISKELSLNTRSQTWELNTLRNVGYSFFFFFFLYFGFEFFQYVNNNNNNKELSNNKGKRKKNKYSDLAKKLKKKNLWNRRVMVIPIVVRVVRTFLIHKVYPENHGKLESEIDGRRGKFSWGENPGTLH